LVPSHERCQTAWSVPRTNTSMRLAAPDTAAGSSDRTPPSDSHALQLVPFQDRCHSALSLPRTNRSVRFAPHDPTAGLEVRTPPSEYHGVVVPNLTLSWFHSSGAPPP